MTFVSFDFQITNQNPSINFFNRAFQYGDGLFETLIVRNSEICFFEDHFTRLIEGLQTLQFSGVYQLDESLKKTHT